MTNNFVTEDAARITKFYEEAFQALDRTRPVPKIAVRFYPYVGINHTIRVREGAVFVRLAEMCAGAPPDVQRALAFILVAKLLRKKVSPRRAEIYRQFVKSREMQTKAVENRRARGRKIVAGARGTVYDLEEIFDRLNRIYFADAVKKPVLSWSARPTYRILGHHDAAHETIIVSKTLDDRKIPPFVVEYVVFHEMLHVVHPTLHRNGRRYNHTAQFRRDERKFADFARADAWIAENAGKLKRRVRAKK